jgi:hypothetical protein
MKTKSLKLPLVIAVVMLLAIAVIPALAAGTVYYSGQGFTFDDTTWIINDERCGLEGEYIANDGGTGQFADWNGAGLPYETGQAYLVWVLTANGATSATLAGGPFGAGVPMYQVGGTYKYASQYFDPSELINVVYATWAGGPRKATLTVSHGCAGFEEGAWCGPGYWLNTLGPPRNPRYPNGWTTIGIDPHTTMFNSTVYDPFYGDPLVPDVSLFTVLDTPGDIYKGPGVPGTDPRTQPPYAALNPFRALGAWATDQIPGYSFDPNLLGEEDACPIDAFGQFKE